MIVLRLRWLVWSVKLLCVKCRTNGHLLHVTVRATLVRTSWYTVDAVAASCTLRGWSWQDGRLPIAVRWHATHCDTQPTSAKHWMTLKAPTHTGEKISNWLYPLFIHCHWTPLWCHYTLLLYISIHYLSVRWVWSIVMSIFACLSVCSHNAKTTQPNFIKFSAACCLWS